MPANSKQDRGLRHQHQMPLQSRNPARATDSYDVYDETRDGSEQGDIARFADSFSLLQSAKAISTKARSGESALSPACSEDFFLSLSFGGLQPRVMPAKRLACGLPRSRSRLHTARQDENFDSSCTEGTRRTQSHAAALLEGRPATARDLQGHATTTHPLTLSVLADAPAQRYRRRPDTSAATHGPGKHACRPVG